MAQTHIYTGNGKGKTTAALGLCLRALGAGFRVFFLQFAKGRPTAEFKALESFASQITIRRFGRPCFIGRECDDADRAEAGKGYLEALAAVSGGEYQLVILDEINIVIKHGLISVREAVDLLDARAGDTELVLTGRDAPDALVEAADLVTEMREIKHYYKAGVRARSGIEF